MGTVGVPKPSVKSFGGKYVLQSVFPSGIHGLQADV